MISHIFATEAVGRRFSLSPVKVITELEEEIENRLAQPRATVRHL